MNDEAKYWRERYEMMAASISDILYRFANPPVLRLADKESYEAGRIRGALDEREACAGLCDLRAQDTRLSNHRRCDAAALADAIRSRGQS